MGEMPCLSVGDYSAPMLVVRACTIGTDRMNKGLAARAEEGRGKNKSLAGWDFHHSIRDAVNRVLRGLASDRNTVAFVDVGHCS